MKPKFIYFIIAVVLIVGAGFYFINQDKNDKGLSYLEKLETGKQMPTNENQNQDQGSSNNESLIKETISKNMKHLITIKTNLGEIQFQTYDMDAPKTVDNFITLANKGFYDGLIFHRVIKGFMIQGGDPTGTGTGGPGYKFEDELNSQTESYKAGYQKGVVAMANAGPDTNGSQFFIMLESNPLPNNYTIFGKVVKGQEIVDKIGSVRTDSSDKPLMPVIMKKINVSVL